MYQQPSLLYPDTPTGALSFPIYPFSPFPLPITRSPENNFNFFNNTNNLNNPNNLKFSISIDAEVERAYGCVLKLNLSKFPFLKGATVSIRCNCVDREKVVKRANKVGKTPQQSDYELDAWIEVEHFNYNYIGNGTGIGNGITGSDSSNNAEEDGVSPSSRTTREILKNCCTEKCKDHTDGIAFFRTFAFVVGQSNNAMEEELPMIFYGAPSHDRRGKKAKFVLRMKLYENGVVLSESEDLVVPYKQSITVKQRNQQGNQQQQQVPKTTKVKTPKKDREGEREAEGEGRKKSRRRHTCVRSLEDNDHHNQPHQIPKKRRKTGLRSEVPTGEDSDINSPLMHSTPSSPSHPSLSPHQHHQQQEKQEQHHELHKLHKQKNSSFRTLSRIPPSQHLPFQPPTLSALSPSSSSSSSPPSSSHPYYHLDLLAALSTNFNNTPHTISPNNSFGSLSLSCNNSCNNSFNSDRNSNGNVIVNNNSSGHYIIGNNSSSSDSAWSAPSRLEAPGSYPPFVPTHPGPPLLPSPYPAQYDLSDLLVYLAEYQLIAPFSQLQNHLLNHYFTNQSNNNHIGGTNLNSLPSQYLEPQHHQQQSSQRLVQMQPMQELPNLNLNQNLNLNLNLNHPNTIPHQIPLEQIPSQICNNYHQHDTPQSIKSISGQIPHGQSQQSNLPTSKSADFHGAFSVAHLLRSRSE